MPCPSCSSLSTHNEISDISSLQSSRFSNGSIVKFSVVVPGKAPTSCLSHKRGVKAICCLVQMILSRLYSCTTTVSGYVRPPVTSQVPRSYNQFRSVPQQPVQIGPSTAS
nr:hypothetical protein [Cressdnaviricota sp.]